MKHKHLIVVTALMFAFSSPAFAQRGHGGGPPPGHGPSGMTNSGASEANAMSHTDMSHASPSDVLSHNMAIAGKIRTLTGEDATAACDGFKNLGQCVAAAHVAQNLSIPGGFAVLKPKITGSGALSLGQAISDLAPKANSKAEVKKANKQASQDVKEAESHS